MEAASPEHKWVEANRDFILATASPAANEETDEEEDLAEAVQRSMDTRETSTTRRANEEPDEEEEEVEGPRGRMGTPKAPTTPGWGDIVSDSDEPPVAKGAMRAKGVKVAQGAKGAAQDAGPAKRRRQSEGGASPSGPSAAAASSSAPLDPETIVQKSVDTYLALDADRKVGKFRKIDNCVAPTLIWWTKDVELWLGGVDHLWDVGNIAQYTTADRVP
jgi:hypothetical protein